MQERVENRVLCDLYLYLFKIGSYRCYFNIASQFGCWSYGIFNVLREVKAGKGISAILIYMIPVYGAAPQIIARG